MPKQLNQSMEVNLRFNADTSQARKELQNLQQTLSNLISSSAANSKLGLTHEVNEAITSANKLKVALEQATDTKTGQLNLAKLSKSIDSKNLTKYAQQMASLGPTGQQAFSQIARAITTASVPLKQSSALLNEFKTTLTNTVRWQLSSSLIHSVVGAVQGAYRYAQDLNESLNNIRIVTGQSADQMAAFADRANKAAQALSTTTNEYAKASLIYYQQGLSDKDVEARANVTMKLANVSRQSAEEVSNQMTAIWNNFAEGSKNLEYYADVITALGASTASSSEEIATGLEKFAAVSKTVGLSYEYATAALATITATTRQSADTVGTGLRTLFSRLESLKLGETLEDGVDLNKYSKALQTVGVDILDATGNLKDMDHILDETAAKWQNLDQAQKMAFASTVGGVRQYTNLIALMDHWDFMQKNVQTAKSSTGTVAEQAQTYAESWEAARDRVKAAWEDIYTKLLDDKAFIKILNITEKLVNGFSSLIDMIGGLPSVLLLVGSIFTKIYQQNIVTFFDNFSYNMKSRTEQLQTEMLNFRRETQDALSKMIPENDSNQGSIAMSQAYQGQAEVQAAYIKKQQEMIANKQKMSELDKAEIESLMEIVNIKTEMVKKTAQEYQNTEKILNNLSSQMKLQKNKTLSHTEGLNNKEIKGLQKIEKQWNGLQNAVEKYNLQMAALGKTYAKFAVIQKSIEDNKGAISEKDLQALESYKQKLQDLGIDVSQINFKPKNTQEFEETMSRLSSLWDETSSKAEQTSQALYKFAEVMKIDKSVVDEYIQSVIHLGNTTADMADSQVQAAEAAKFVKQHIESVKATLPTLSEGFAQMTSATLTYIMALNQLSNLSEVWTSEQSILQKLTTTLMAVGVAIRGVTSVSKALNAVTAASNALKTENIIKTLSVTKQLAFQQAVEKKNLTIWQQSVLAKKLQKSAEDEHTISIIANTEATMMNPWFAIAAAVLMVAVVAISAVTNAIKKQNEVIKENASKTAESFNKTKEITDQNKELLKTYEDLYSIYQKTHKVNKELTDSALAVAEAYGIQNASLLIAQGRYNDLEQAVNNARLAELDKIEASNIAALNAQQVSNQKFIGTNLNFQGYIPGDEAEDIVQGAIQAATHVETSTEAAGGDFLANILKKIGVYDLLFPGTSNDEPSNMMQGYQNYMSANSKDENFIRNIFKDEDNTFKNVILDETTGNIKASIETNREFLDTYEDFMLILEKANLLTTLDDNDPNKITTDQLQESELYKQANDFTEKYKDNYNTLLELMTANQDIAAEHATRGILGTDEELKDGINSYQDFLKLQEKVQKSLTDDGYENAAKMANDYFKTVERFLPYLRQQAMLTELSEETGIDLTELTEKYESLTDSEKTLFVNLNWDIINEVEDITNQLLNRSQDVAKQEAQTFLSTIKGIRKELKEGMDYEDLELIHDQYIDFFTADKDKGTISWADFLSKSYEEQIEYLEDMQKRYSKEYTENTGLQGALQDVDAYAPIETSTSSSKRSGLGGGMTRGFIHASPANPFSHMPLILQDPAHGGIGVDLTDEYRKASQQQAEIYSRQKGSEITEEEKNEEKNDIYNSQEEIDKIIQSTITAANTNPSLNQILKDESDLLLLLNNFAANNNTSIEQMDPTILRYVAAFFAESKFNPGELTFGMHQYALDEAFVANDINDIPILAEQLKNLEEGLPNRLVEAMGIFEKNNYQIINRPDHLFDNIQNGQWIPTVNVGADNILEGETAQSQPVSESEDDSELKDFIVQQNEGLGTVLAETGEGLIAEVAEKETEAAEKEAETVEAEAEMAQTEAETAQTEAETQEEEAETVEAEAEMAQTEAETEEEIVNNFSTAVDDFVEAVTEEETAAPNPENDENYYSPKPVYYEKISGVDSRSVTEEETAAYNPENDENYYSPKQAYYEKIPGVDSRSVTEEETEAEEETAAYNPENDEDGYSLDFLANIADKTRAIETTLDTAFDNAYSALENFATSHVDKQVAAALQEAEEERNKRKQEADRQRAKQKYQSSIEQNEKHKQASTTNAGIVTEQEAREQEEARKQAVKEQERKQAYIDSLESIDASKYFEQLIFQNSKRRDELLNLINQTFTDESQLTKTQYENLENLINDETWAPLLAQYFTVMEDGTYKLTGSAEKFNEVIDTIYEQTLIGQNNTIRNAAGGNDSLNNLFNINAQSDNDSLKQLASFLADTGLVDTSSFLDENNNLFSYFNDEGEEIIPDNIKENLILALTAIKDLFLDNQKAIAINIESLSELNEQADQLTDDQYAEVLERVSIKAMESATTLEQLQGAASAAMEMGYEDFGVYSECLIKLAEQYNNTADEIEKYNNALMLGDKSQIEAAESALELAINIGELAKKYGFDAEETENYAHRLADSFEEEGMSKEASARLGAQVAIANQRLDRGLKKLNESLEDYIKKLAESNEGSFEWSSTLDDLKDNLADILNVDISTLTDEFALAALNSEDLKKALDGDVDAIWRLQEQAAEGMILEIQSNLPENSQELEIFMNQWDYLKANMAEAIQSPGVDQTNLWNSFNSMIEAGNLTKEQIETALAGLHVSADVETTYVPQTVSVPQTITEEAMLPAGFDTVQVPGPDGDWVEKRVFLKKKLTRTYDAGTVDVQGVVPRYSIKGTKNQDGTITTAFAAAPKVTPSFSSTTSGIAAGNKSPKSSNPKSPKSSEPKEEKRDEKHKDDEAERYHLINSQIDQQTYKLDRLSKAKDRAWGKNKLKAMDAELQALANLGAMYEKHAEASQGWLDTDKAALDTFLRQHGGVAAQYGSDGSILNYRSLFEANLAAYNGAVDAYNSGAIEKEGLENAEKQYEEFQKLLQNYEDSLKQHQDDVDKVVENAIAQYDALTAKNQARIEMRLEFDDYSLDLLDKFINRLETWAKSPFNGAATLAQLNEKTGQLLDKNETLMFGLDSTLTHFLKDYEEFDENGAVSWATGKSDEEVKAFLERYHNNELTEDDLKTIAHLPEEEAKLLKDYTEQLQENSDALIGTADEVVQAVVSVFDTTKEEMEEASKPIKRAAEALDNYSQIIDIVGQDYLGISDDMMTAMGQMDISIKHTATAAAREIMETLTYERDQVQGLMDSAIENGNLELAEKYRQELKGINDDVQEATENFHQAWRDELSAAREEFEKAVDRAKEAMLDGFAGPNNTWRQLKDSFDYAKEAADRYVPQYKEIYELSKLNRDINKSIDDTDNIKNKQALRDLQKEINKLEENSGKISQYDLDNARRRYELELARLQLEEAGNMKDIVRLSKDSEGNWSYIYTANEEDVAAAEQNYEDKLYAMQEANSNYINELQDQIIQAEEAYAEKVAEIMKDNTLSEEQRQALLLAAREQFDETMQYYGGELDKAINNNKELYDKDWTWYANYTARKAEQEGKITDDGRTQLGYRLGDQEKYVDDFNETMLGAETGYNTLDGYNQAVAESVQTNTNKMNQDFQLWQNNTEAAMQGAGTSVETFGEDMEVAGVKVTDFLDRMREAGYGADDYSADISELSTELTDDFIPSLVGSDGEGGALGAVKKFGKDARADMDETVRKAEWWRQQYAEKIGSEDDPNSILGQNKLVAESLKNVLDYVSQFEPDPDITITYNVIEPQLPQLPTEHHIRVIYDTSGGSPAAPSGGGGGGGGSATSGGGGGGGAPAPTPQAPKPAGPTETQYRIYVDNGNNLNHQVYVKMSDGSRGRLINGAEGHVWSQHLSNVPVCSRCNATYKQSNAKSGGGCFAPGTQILMADGITTKSIETIKLGEKILSYNEELDTFEAKTVTWVYFRQGYNQLMRLYLSNGQIIDMTLGHPIYTLDGWKSKDVEMSLNEHKTEVTLLDEQDILIGYQEQISIIDIQYFAVPNNYIVYCLGIDDNHTFIANGIIVHNAITQDVAHKLKYASGGYTGEWVGGSQLENGRWALLHQKELVLNEDDTKNILSAVDMVRGFSQAIDQYASTSQFALGNLSAAYSINASRGTLEQMVHITAEFPAATNRGEIEAAFETLINQASQYANRERF